MAVLSNLVVFIAWACFSAFAPSYDFYIESSKVSKTYNTWKDRSHCKISRWIIKFACILDVISIFMALYNNHSFWRLLVILCIFCSRFVVFGIQRLQITKKMSSKEQNIAFYKYNKYHKHCKSNCSICMDKFCNVGNHTKYKFMNKTLYTHFYNSFGTYEYNDSVILKCGHRFHKNCCNNWENAYIKQKIKQYRNDGKSLHSIDFNIRECPICKTLYNKNCEKYEYNSYYQCQFNNFDIV